MSPAPDTCPDRVSLDRAPQSPSGPAETVVPSGRVRGPRRPARWRWLAVAGPGIVVMLADTDAGTIITAAQSGAQWGYKLLLLQFLLMPMLFVVQELTVRLGVVTGRGHGELIVERFGSGWAWLSVSTLMLACIGAIVTQLSGMAGVGELFGVPAWTMMVGGGLLAMVWTGSYRSVERIAIALRPVRAGLRAGAALAGRAAGSADPGPELAQMPLGNGEIPLSGRRQPRRGDHAVDDLLPAVGGAGKAGRRRPEGRALGHRGRGGGHPGGHGRRADRDRGHARSPGGRSPRLADAPSRSPTRSRRSSARRSGGWCSRPA